MDHALLAVMTLAGATFAHSTQPHTDQHADQQAALTETDDSTEQEPAWVQRVGGDMEIELQSRPGREGDLYSSEGVYTDTKLPVGYPTPTPPGAIELKHYPTFRRAEVSGEGDGGSSGRSGFMPLFRHISNNGIAMTAPVEMEYRDFDNDEDTDVWTMAFLYHTTDDGPTGKDRGGVRIVDADAVTVLSLGVRGGRSVTRVADYEAALERWLEENAADWKRADESPVRVLGYNGPSTPVANRWWEVQLLVEPKEAGDEVDADVSPERKRQLEGLRQAIESNTPDDSAHHH